MNRPKAHGFTLLEAVLAVTLTVALVGGALAFYQHVGDVRRSVLAQAEYAAADRGVMDRLTGELRSARAHSLMPVGIVGDNDRIDLMTIALPGALPWTDEDEDEVTPSHDVRMVGYRLKTYEDDDGEYHNDGLQRSCQYLLAEEMAEEGREILTEVVAPPVKFVRFRYHDGSGWVDAWPAQLADEEFLAELEAEPGAAAALRGAGMPLAVEITLGAEPMPDDMEAEDYLLEYPTSRRVVYIPGSKLGAMGPLARGGLDE